MSLAPKSELLTAKSKALYSRTLLSPLIELPLSILLSSGKIVFGL